MLSYEQISRLERDLYRSLNEVKDIFDAAKDSLYYKRLQEAAQNDRYKIISRFYSYLTNGVCYPIAIESLCLDFNLGELTIKKIVEPVYRQHLANLRPYKIYAAHMMKKAGITNKKIAEILNITQQTVCKYLTIKPSLGSV